MDSAFLPHVTLGAENGKPIFFLAGYPDDELSGWGPEFIDQLKKSGKYKLVFMCLPGYSVASEYKSQLKKTWGYSFDQILTMMDKTIIQNLNGRDEKIILAVHDWGSYVGQLYQATNPNKVEKLILFDIGRISSMSPYNLFFNILYQWWFIGAYLTSQLLSKYVGTLVLLSFFMVGKYIGPTPHDKVNRPIKELKVDMCYPYFHFWTSKRPSFPHPQCPILFMYGLKKRCFWHDEKFLKRLDEDPKSVYKAFNAGHWFMTKFPEETTKEMFSFIEN